MTKRKPWSKGREIMRRQIDKAKQDIKEEIDRKAPEPGEREEGSK